MLQKLISARISGSLGVLVEEAKPERRLGSQRPCVCFRSLRFQPIESAAVVDRPNFMAEKYIKRSDVAADEGDPAKKFYLCEDSFVLTDHDAHMWFESLKDLFDGTRNDVDAERRRRFSNAYMFKMGGKCYKQRPHADKDSLPATSMTFACATLPLHRPPQSTMASAAPDPDARASPTSIRNWVRRTVR